MLDISIDTCYTIYMSNIISQIRTRFDHAAAKKILKEKYEAKMVFAHAGGMWKAGPELINTITACSDPEMVLIDQYETPVRVVRADLLNLATERWQEQMNAWELEWSELQKQR